MPDDTIIADILRSDTEDGVPVANIGEDTTGEGFGADTIVWGNGDGFVSVPNQPSDAGVAQAVVTQDGHVKRAVQTRDQRWVTKAGTLQPGDRAVVSDSEAWIRLTRASDKIEIVSGARTIVIDGSKVEITNALGKVSVSSTGVTLSSGVTSSITVSPTGVAIVVPPAPATPPATFAGFTVNGTPMIVP